MAVSQALLDQLMDLDDEERLEVAQLLLATLDDEDELDDAERARLNAALARSMEAIKVGRFSRCARCDRGTSRATSSVTRPRHVDREWCEDTEDLLRWLV
jgi:hypothetical protein